MEASPHALKGVEALYALTKAAFDAEISRYDASEAKAGRYLTVLGLVIGAFVVKFDDLVMVFLNTQAPRWAALTFVGAYALTVSAALVAFGLAFMAMRITEVPAIPVGEEIEGLFRDKDIKVALEQTTESFRTGARKLRDTTEQRMRYLETTNRLLILIVIAAVASLGGALNVIGRLDDGNARLGSLAERPPVDRLRSQNLEVSLIYRCGRNVLDGGHLPLSS